ncbi:uncharacterized protein LOC111701110 [Eurytemora carolleeae]|uniref:uncharacterized protein LOC111701110 n=1 Tax=Eurytemora carolleeae TaxID=1294199 RepID=UPI000C760A4C|nr:uncharacterized protein LOC111701110 [Eurytemora carolleeae]|eukprot:XP_023328030.1 uncharacterized protein LOC111701110 [Eurytemora affinis]
MKPPCPTAGFMPPTPPFSWIKGEVRFNKTEVPPPTRFPYFSGNIPTLQAQYFRNCPTPPVFGVGLSTPPPLHPCTPPPPPVTWSQSVTSDQMGYQTIWGRVSASSRYQRGWVSGFNTTPVHGSPRWLDRQTTGEFNPGFKQCGDGAYPIRNSIFGIKVDQDELEYNKYGDPFVNQGFVLMTPPGSSSDYPQYQVSPLARPYGFSSQQYQQFTSFPGTFELRGYHLTQESLFSQSFSVPPVPSPTSSRKFTFPVSPLSPTTARSPLSPGLSTAGSPLSPGLSTGLYHIPPINTNSPESAGQKRVPVGSTCFPSYFSQGK